MNAKIIIQELKDMKIASPFSFAQRFKIEEEDALEILEQGVAYGVLYMTSKEEYCVKEIIKADDEEDFQDFLNKFYRDIKRLQAIKIFNREIQALKFQKLQPFFYDKNGVWWLWDIHYFMWEMTDDVDMLNMIKEATGRDTSNSKFRTEILNTMKQLGRMNIPQDIKPSWVQFQDKIIDIETGEELTAHPKYFVTNPISWKIGRAEETPKIDKLFISWVGEEHKDELYEIIAFSIIPYYFIHRIICLIGSGANGKSTYLKVLKKFIGKNNVTSISLDALMGQRFAGAKLLKKLVCLMGETNFNTLSKTDFLKKLCGEDDVPGEFKNKNPFDFVNYAKLIMASNSLPMTADKTDGFYRRWKIIDFPNKFNEEIDVFSTIPDKEFENLALKCLNIAKKLWGKRIFINDGDFEDRRRRYEEKSNPIMLYITENFEKDINSEILFGEFYEGLRDFLIENGFRELTLPIVSKQLKIEGLDVKTLTRNQITAKFILGLQKKGEEKIDPQTKITMERIQ